MIRAVIFDLGHTLWNYAPSEHARRLNVLRLREALAAWVGSRVPTPQDLDRTLGLVVGSWYERYHKDDLRQPPSAQIIREVTEALDLSLSPDAVEQLTTLFFGNEQEMPVVEPDTLASLGELDRRGLAMGCVTNTLTLEPGIHDVLERLGLKRYLRSVVVSSALGRWKPHPSLFQRALEGLGVRPEQAIFVGDRLLDDVAGAHSVGMRAVLTHQYRQEPLDGAVARPVTVIPRLSELPQALDALEADA